MKKLIFTIALAAGMALPMASTKVQADPDYQVKNNLATLWQHSFARGDIRCQIKKGARVNRHWGDNWARWIYVKVTSTNQHWASNIAGIGCKGWIDKRDLISLGGNQSSEGFVTLTTKRNTAWGREIPVFKDRKAFFDARGKVHRTGEYPGMDGKIVCKIKHDRAVKFKQFKDWGVGEVKSGNCSGWIDANALYKVN